MPWLSVKRAAIHLDVSERTVRKLLKNGLPHSRLLQSGSIRIEESQLDEWMRQQIFSDESQQIVKDLLEGLT